MKQYTQREFIKICIVNGFYYSRHNGDHAIYVNDKGRHISIPKHLESVIARRLIKENNLEINIKNLKKEKRMSNAPLGADEDPRAPWNQPLDVKHKRFVSVTISYYDEVELPSNVEEEQIKEALEEKVRRQDFPKKIDFDEIVILEE